MQTADRRQFIRFAHSGMVAHGEVVGTLVQPLSDAPWADAAPAGDPIDLEAVALLAPVVPTKCVAIALNYPSHLGTQTPPARPEPFLKAPSSVIGPGETIVLPAGAGRVDAEGELVAVIGSTCRKVGASDALDHVFAYTCGNDVSARDWQRDDKQWFRAKSSDTFGVLGPWLVTGIDPGDTELRVRIDGQEVQAANTGEMLFDLATIIAGVSQVMTLVPGDVIYTGTPGVTGQLAPGTTVEVELAGIGVLTNPVVAEEGS